MVRSPAERLGLESSPPPDRRSSSHSDDLEREIAPLFVGCTRIFTYRG